GAAAAGQHEVLGAVAGEPAGQVRADAAGAAGDQDRAARTPRLCRLRVVGGDHAAGQEATGADGELVLVRHGQGGAEQFHGGGLGVRQVDEAAPALGQVEGEDGAQAPNGGLRGVGHGAARGDGAGGDGPQRGGDVEVAERLDERDGGGARVVGEREQG